MTEDLSLKYSPSIVDTDIDITNVEDVLTTIELDYSDLCGMDTLLRIDEAPEILSCKHCIFQEMIIDDGDVVCPIRVIEGIFSNKKGNNMKDKVRDVIVVVGMGTVSLCAVDTVIRIEDMDMNIYSCENCLFREELDAVVCPYRMMYTRGRRVLL